MVLFLAAFQGVQADGESVPAGYGQLEEGPALIPGGTDEEGRDYAYLGQPARNGKLILTASNGFFTKGVAQAKGESSLPKVGDEDLIQPNFEFLDWKAEEGSLRWHLYIAQPGMARFGVHLGSQGGAEVEASFAGDTKTVTAARSGSDEAQPWNLEFQIDEPGEYTLALAAKPSGNGASVGQLHRIDAFGPAIEGAHLLRVRWRPAAVHGGYDTEQVRNAKLLVFTTRSMTPVSNYSPITTPFGYYGTSFEADQRSNGSFNFSMWGKEGAAQDLKTMPHLLAVGSRVGEFSGFGHEGSGVKPRGWDPMPDRPNLVVQALRLEPGELYDSYYGYYYDHPSESWKLYGAGNKWHGGKPTEHLKLGSFCEVPGPPQVERTGDVYREVRRRAWVYQDGDWLPLEIYKPGGMGSSGEPPVNKSWYTTQDGEYAMGCGGIRLYRHKDSLIKPGSGPLPEFLSAMKIEPVFRLPIDYGTVQATEVAADQAVLDIEVIRGGELGKGAVYYGNQDALTFAPRELHGTEKKSELSQAVNGMSWEQVAEMPTVEIGHNQVQLSDLKPETTYYYRVLTSNAESQVWTSETGSFTTLKAGALPISSPVTTMESEPFRTWAYRIDGDQRTLEARLIGISGDQITLERKADGKSGTMKLELFSAEDQQYVDSKR